MGNGPNALHGGLVGLDKVVWKATAESESVIFSFLSADGDEGYPGDVLYNVKYSLSPEGVRLDFSAMVTAATPFNLAGHSSGDSGLYDHVVEMKCAEYTPVSEKLIPTGEIATVEGDVFDLRKPTRLGDILPKCPGGENNGFDHNFLVPGSDRLNLVCRVKRPGTGVWLECLTDQPGCQFYTGNFLPVDNNLVGKEGAIYKKHGGFCLETQKFPDSINQLNFPNSVVRPGQVYQHAVVYKVGKN